MTGPCARAIVGNILFLAAGSAAAGGPFGIDHRMTPTESGIWARRYALSLEYGAVAAGLGGAFWLGSESELGATFWQAADAEILGQIAAQGMKYAFGRERPSQTDDPARWFKGTHAQSFPSGEVTLQASLVTPFVVNYGDRAPWVWALEALPAYDAAARVREGGHWQSDVLAGWLLGSAFGYYAAKSKSPFFLNIVPHGIQVGLRSRF